MKPTANHFFPTVTVSLLLISLISCKDPLNETIYINNGKIELGFDKNSGKLVSFRDLISSFDILDSGTDQGSPWEIEFLTKTRSGRADNSLSTQFKYSKSGPSSIILQWRDFKEVDYKDLIVTVRIRLDEDKPLSYWNISVEGIKGLAIRRVIFPKIPGIRRMPNEHLAIPAWMGQLVREPRDLLAKRPGIEKRFAWSYPGPLSMQCFALYEPGAHGFYAACNDSLAYIKNFSFSLDSQDHLTYQVENFPALDTTLKSYSTTYEAILGSFTGDWITAAEIYREWGARQKWSRESRFRKGLVEPWLEENALWVWNRNESGDVLTPAIQLKQRLNLPVNVFWHWWHGCSYDDGFPEYFPPREGKDPFISAMSTAHDQGVNAIVYMNHFQWGDSTKSWKAENAGRYAVKDVNGKTLSHVYNIFSGKPLTNMCIATPFWKDWYASLCDSAVNVYHTNGVYMDQACLNRMCYDSSHGHPLGGGNYWVKNFGLLTEQIRSKFTHNHQPILAGEGCGEAWLPYLDAFLTLQVSMERYAGLDGGEPIPFFQSVYHPYGITYGNYSSLLIPPYDILWPKEFAPEDPNKLLDEEFNQQFLMEQARSFVWGLQPTIANYRDFLVEKRKDEIKFLIDLVKVRKHGLKYLLLGKFLRSPAMDVPSKELNISRLSIYAGREGKSVTKFRKTFPLIYAGTWKADDGQVGIALANINDAPVNLNFGINIKDYELPESGEVYITDAEGKRLLMEYIDDNLLINFDIPAKGVCMLEIVPGK
ncbi:MAG TPA: DUF6259 domain-containing protein [Cyclobacteriaceae bacterium]|nr:DUF6259 domain-containing protein [Cyclobacteriaceae bacterium]